LLQAVDSGDVAAIQAAVTQLTPSMANLSKARIQLGVDLSRLEALKTEHDAQELNIRERRGRIEDANLAEAITDLTQIQTALKASLSAQGTIQPRNLFDYLG
jgi:flagellar hook-associated protein 3 FlgL